MGGSEVPHIQAPRPRVAVLRHLALTTHPPRVMSIYVLGAWQPCYTGGRSCPRPSPTRGHPQPATFRSHRPGGQQGPTSSPTARLHVRGQALPGGLPPAAARSTWWSLGSVPQHMVVPDVGLTWEGDRPSAHSGRLCPSSPSEACLAHPLAALHRSPAGRLFRNF